MDESKNFIVNLDLKLPTHPSTKNTIHPKIDVFIINHLPVSL